MIIADQVLKPREWLLKGGGGHEDGADGLRTLIVGGKGLIEFLQAYREYLQEHEADRNAAFALAVAGAYADAKTMVQVLIDRRTQAQDEHFTDPGSGRAETVKKGEWLGSSAEQRLLYELLSNIRQRIPDDAQAALELRIEQERVKLFDEYSANQAAVLEAERERIRTRVLAEINKKYDQYGDGGWARQSDVEDAVNCALKHDLKKKRKKG